MGLEAIIALRRSDLAESVRGALARHGVRVRRVEPEDLAAALTLGRAPDLIVTAERLEPEQIPPAALLITGRLDEAQVLRRLELFLEATRPVPATLPLVDGEVDLVDGVVRRTGGDAKLTPTELELLRYLAVQGTATEEALRLQVWGFSERAVSNAVKSAVYRLRRKIEVEPSNPVHLRTDSVYGYGLFWQREGSPARTTNLGASPGPLFGRVATLARLEDAIEEGARLIEIVGAIGAGKSRVAEALAQRVLGRGTGAVFLCDLSAAATVADVCREVTAALDLPTSLCATVVDAVQGVRVALERDPPALLVLDDVDLARDGVREALTAWQTVASTVFVTTASVPLELPRARRIRVDPLAPESARELLWWQMARANPSLLGAEPPAGVLDEIIAHVDAMPLALHLAGAQAVALTPAQIRDRCAAPASFLRGADPARPAHGGLLGGLWRTWEGLEPGARTALAAASVMCVPFEPAELAHLVEVSRAEGEAIVGQLLRANLARMVSGVGEAGGMRIVLFQVVRDFAAERLAERDDATAVGLRRAAVLAAEARAWGDASNRGDRRGAFAWFRSRLSGMRRLLLALQGVDDPAVDALAELVVAAIGMVGPLEEGPALGARILAARPGAARLRMRLAWALHYQGRETEALGHATEAADALEASGDLDGAVHALWCCVMLRRAAPQAFVARALALAEASGDAALIAGTLHHEAITALSRGEPAAVLEPLARAARLYETHGWAYLRGRVLTSLGYAKACLGRDAAAVATLARSAAAHDASGATYAAADARSLEAAARLVSGDLAGAQALFDAAIPVLERYGSAYHAALLESQRAVAHLLADALADASESLLRSEGLLARMDMAHTRARVLGLRALVAARQADIEGALLLLDEAAALLVGTPADAVPQREHALLRGAVAWASDDERLAADVAPAREVAGSALSTLPLRMAALLYAQEDARAAAA